jgi:hypothetical protein
MTGALLLVLAAGPVLEAEIDSQTREDDELPPSSVLPYTPHFEGKALPGLTCGQKATSSEVQKLLDEGTRLTDTRDTKQVRKAVPKLQRALSLDPKAGWAYLILGSAYAKLGDTRAGTQAYETYLLSCRTAPNTDRVQRILTDFWLATGGKDTPVQRR